MRMAIALILAGLAFWRAALDWRATIGEGYAFQMTSFERAFAENWPGAYQSFVDFFADSSIPYLWQPVLVTLLSLPMTVVAIVAAGLFWFTRPRKTFR